MGRFSGLPEELLHHVAMQASLPILRNLALTCRLLWRICIPVIVEKQLRAKFRRQETGQLCELYVQVVHSSIPVEYVEEVVVDSRTTWQWDFDLGDPAVLNALRMSAWLLDEEKSMIFDHYKEYGYRTYGVELEGLTTVLLTRLPNLKRLDLRAPCYGGLDMDMLPDVVGRIAVLAASSSGLSIDTESPRKQLALPFQNLREIVYGDEFNSLSRADLAGLASFLALPNVRLARAYHVFADEFEWPSHLPKSRVTKIDFYTSAILQAALEGMARGILGPCIIQQPTEGPNRAYRHWNSPHIALDGASEHQWCWQRLAVQTGEG